ncbi:hypothetical protein GP2_024_00810 [Gordonia paraffinivorans NBRC 108238]|uniref:FAD-binding domain-containing protein n=1 Tax=Gordonia paraffinivorans NBRC 108238 TaxID=1223543 RepID=A0ABQ0IMC4_9ACTN|nr:FAD-dependent monooxygenase [Gordonia paraffinivorans]GAC84654.1 hypothetical protein GP2_024_00810 [Gordonia paraffinivorans NBRC 108238]
MTTVDKPVAEATATEVETEYADVVIVGTRISGTAAAVVFARAGLRVIGLDKSRFPSDTMSTHIMVPNAVQELARMGALEKVLALNPAKSKYLTFDIGDVHIRERMRPYGGIDYGLTIPRDQLDVLLAEAARDAGADMRERCLVEEVLMENGRAVGVRYRTTTGRHEIRAKLVIGADGRKSKVAAGVGAWEPYRGSKNGRGFAYRYIDDPIGADKQDTYQVFRAEGNQALVMPSAPAGRAIVVHMCYASDIPRFREDPEGGVAGEARP